MKKEPKKEMNACMDLLTTVFEGHILAAACTQLGIGSLAEKIPSGRMPGGLQKAHPAIQKSYIII